MAQQLDTIEGSVENIVYHNNETGFTVMEIATGEELLTVVGETLSIGEGEQIRATGSYGTHPTYGRQFKAEALELVLPASASAMLKYLSSGAIKGVGPVFAKRIVDKFGDRTLEILEGEPSSLATVKGITAKKAVEIGEEYQRILGVRSVMLFLSAHGIDPATAIAVWKKWGGMAQTFVTTDPYCLCGQDIGVEFEQADQIADSLGMSADNPCRVRGGVLYVITHNLLNGHCCLPLDKLSQTAAGLLDVTGEQTQQAVVQLRETAEIIGDVIEGEEFIYLPEQYAAETYISGRLALLCSLGGQDRPVDEAELKGLEEKLSITYANRQQKAITSAVQHPVMILTGGPGTGKTTTLNGIITLFEQRGMKVSLAAPTGRAAKRLSEVTGREAKTIHRLLEVDFGSEVANPKFKRNERNPLQADAIIVDEMSMVDARLFCSLLKALRMNSRLVLVGDPDQLPSVGAGNILRDLIDSEMLESVHLDEVFRQAAESLIVMSAHEIVSGRLPKLTKNDSDFFFLPRNTAEQTAATVVDLAARRLPKAYGYSPLKDIQVLAPSRQGTSGTFELNRLLQMQLNPASPQKTEHKIGSIVFREGDKVMQIRNNYDLLWQKPDGEEGLGVFNGDIGFVEMIDRPSHTVMVRFEERLAIYSFDMLNELELAYAITIHKSQGNEFDAVIIPLVGRHKRLHYRNLLYTAVTRARKLLIITGHSETVAEMVENNRKTLRYTKLAQRLKAEL